MAVWEPQATVSSTSGLRSTAGQGVPTAQSVEWGSAGAWPIAAPLPPWNTHTDLAQRLAAPALNQGWGGEPALASWKQISELKHPRASFDHKLVIKHKREKVRELTSCLIWNTASTFPLYST